jgi:hypothetical protein
MDIDGGLIRVGATGNQAEDGNGDCEEFDE